MNDEYPDAAKPITREWWRNEYGECRVFLKCGLRVFYRVNFDQRRGEIWIEDDMSEGVAMLDHIRTRGQLRQLLAALGYQDKDSMR